MLSFIIENYYLIGLICAALFMLVISIMDSLGKLNFKLDQIVLVGGGIITGFFYPIIIFIIICWGLYKLYRYFKVR